MHVTCGLARGGPQLWNADHGRVEEACRESLSKLGLEYIDLYLMHCAPPAAGCRRMPHLVM